MESDVPPPKAKRVAKLGALRGKVRVAPDFDAPLPPEVVADFEGAEATAEAIRAARAGQVTKVKWEDL